MWKTFFYLHLTLFFLKIKLLNKCFSLSFQIKIYLRRCRLQRVKINFKKFGRTNLLKKYKHNITLIFNHVKNKK